VAGLAVWEIPYVSALKEKIFGFIKEHSIRL